MRMIQLVIKVYIDDHTPKYFCSQPNLQGRHGRWVELMQEFHMEIIYCKDQDNVVTDALSRMINNMSFTILDNALLQHIKEAQLDNPYE